jgi:hypothetical protein
MQGRAVVDGVLDDPDWRRATPIIRSQAWRDDGLVTIRLLYSEVGLLVWGIVRSGWNWATR